MKKIFTILFLVTTLLSITGTAHSSRPLGAGGGGGGVSMPPPKTAVSNPQWKAPNPSGLARAIDGKKEHTTFTERDQLDKEKWYQRNIINQ